MKNGKAACREYTSFLTSRKPFDAQCACAGPEVNAAVSAGVLHVVRSARGALSTAYGPGSTEQFIQPSVANSNSSINNFPVGIYRKWMHLYKILS